MSALLQNLTVNDLAFATRWDKLIAADLVREVETDTADHVETIEEMRRFLAIKGYRQLHDLLTAETKGRTGAAALKAMAAASRRYAKERPGLSAATFRSPILESPEWMEAFCAVRQLFEKAFSECGLDQVEATHALRILRSLVRGFVINEMAGSFSGSEDFDESFELAVKMFVDGLPVLRTKKRADEFSCKRAAAAPASSGRDPLLSGFWLTHHLPGPDGHIQCERSTTLNLGPRAAQSLARPLHKVAAIELSGTSRE